MSALVAGLATAAAALALLGASRGLAGLPAAVRARRRPGLGVAHGMSPVGRRIREIASAVTAGVRGRRAAEDRLLPALLDGITRELRSGAALPGAVAAAASARPEPSTRRLGAELNRGVPLVVAVAGWVDASGSPARRLVGAALDLAVETGGATGQVLDGVADTLRERLALEREVGALSSQARASAALLVVAPVVFAVLAAAADPRVGAVLTRDPVGWACLTGGVLLDGAGALWMRKMIGGHR